MPRCVVAGNWKMYQGPDEARSFFAELAPTRGAGRPDLLIFPPAVTLPAAVVSAPAWVALGVQNIHWEDKGAFTGEISAPLARAAGATHALIGHSERRHVFGETDEQVAKKVTAALRNGLVPVVCVGETITERRAGQAEAVILRQIDAALAALAQAKGGFLIAYEPVWAIGTGETATPQDASAAQGALRARMRDRLGKDAEGVPILYGGSVKPENAAELMAAPDVDGVLVGGASLEAGSFTRIADAAPNR